MLAFQPSQVRAIETAFRRPNTLKMAVLFCGDASAMYRVVKMIRTSFDAIIWLRPSHNDICADLLLSKNLLHVATIRIHSTLRKAHLSSSTEHCCHFLQNAWCHFPATLPTRTLLINYWYHPLCTDFIFRCSRLELQLNFSMHSNGSPYHASPGHTPHSARPSTEIISVIPRMGSLQLFNKVIKVIKAHSGLTPIPPIFVGAWIIPTDF